MHLFLEVGTRTRHLQALGTGTCLHLSLYISLSLSLDATLGQGETGLLGYDEIASKLLSRLLLSPETGEPRITGGEGPLESVSRGEEAAAVELAALVHRWEGTHRRAPPFKFLLNCRMKPYHRKFPRLSSLYTLFSAHDTCPVSGMSHGGR